MILGLRARVPLASFTLEVDLEIHQGVTGLFGPSGAGKTTLLDLVAGLRRAPEVFVQVGERVLTDTAAGIRVPARERRLGYVPQDLALFPHLSVRRNLLYGHSPGGDRLFTLDHVTELLDLGPLVDRGVGSLSGGEKQRVALGRALLAAPELLLLDEPLAGLDRPRRGRILEYLRKVRDDLRVPMLYVSHQPEEIVALCEEVILIAEGRVRAQGVPTELFAPVERIGYEPRI
jgi:molybdate transport system ATP-binding protein